MFSKLEDNKIACLKMCKKISLVLAKYQLVPQYWLEKPVVEVSVKMTCKGPMLAIFVNKTPVL